MIMKVAFLDDDLILPDLLQCDESVNKALNDETSPEFDITLEYIREHHTDIDSSDIDSVLDFVNSTDFFEKVLKDDSYHKLFGEEFESFRGGLVESIERIENKQKSLQPFLSFFNDSERFHINRMTSRPVNNNDLFGYDIIIMDIMMNDHFDNNFPGLAKYLGGIYDVGGCSALFLISSRPELDDEKELLRKEAKVSSLNFSILKKNTDLVSPSARIRIELAYEQMLKAKEAGKILRDFSLDFEQAICKAAENTLKNLWCLDFPYLQQMYMCAKNENVPYAEHLLSTLSYNLLENLEKNVTLNTSFGGLINTLCSSDEKYSSFSGESELAMHNMEAAVHFTGSSVDNIKFEHVFASDDEIVHTLPFGLIVVKPSANMPIMHDGAQTFINCTQQCDLSRNIIKQGVNLLFVEARLAKSPDNNKYSLPLPTYLDGDKNRWWLIIDDKKIHAKSCYDFLRQFSCVGFKPIVQARASVVRQIRDHLLHSISRTEENVKTGHNNLFYVDLISKGNSQRFTVGENTQTVLLYEFPGKSNKTFHLLDQSHVDVINWIFDQIPNLQERLSVSELESILKNDLPKIDKRVEHSNIAFAIRGNNSKIKDDTLINGKCLHAVVFTMV